MLKGVTEKELEIIKNIIKIYPYRFYAYGSRVRGDFTTLSDLDLGVRGNIAADELRELREKFDESLLPFVVNITLLDEIDKNFYNLIKDDLTELPCDC